MWRRGRRGKGGGEEWRRRRGGARRGEDRREVMEKKKEEKGGGKRERKGRGGGLRRVEEEGWGEEVRRGKDKKGRQEKKAGKERKGGRKRKGRGKNRGERIWGGSVLFLILFQYFPLPMKDLAFLGFRMKLLDKNPLTWVLRELMLCWLTLRGRGKSVGSAKWWRWERRGRREEREGSY